MVTLPARLQEFVDDELLRAPLLVDQTVEEGLGRIRKAMAAMPAHERKVAADVVQAANSNRQHIVAYYVKSLRQQIASGRGQPAPSAPLRPSLSLVDEDEVAVDVEISHTIEVIRSTAEYELRELQTYTSALVGDMDVARDHNPLRAETHARALWAAAQAIPLSRGYQLVFMRHAAAALPQMLRKAYAGASSRLEFAGVEPAAHRTLILPPGSRRARPSEITFQPDFGRIRDSLPQPTDMSPRGPASNAGAQSTELLARLYAQILDDPQLGADTRALLARLQPAVLRAGVRDPQALDRDDHPAWRFVDRIAFLGEALPEPPDAERSRVLKLVQALVDHVAGEAEQTAAGYDWALLRLVRQEQHRFEQRCTAAAHEIELLQTLEDRLVASPTAPTTMHGTLDVAQLDTVPAELFSTEPLPKRSDGAAQAWLQQRQPGDWARMFMQGRWVLAQLLWPGERGEVFLFVDGASTTTWAVRKRALLTLHAEKLLDSAEPRSLLRDAARRVMRKLTRT